MTVSLAIVVGAVFGLFYMGVLWGAVRVLTSGQSVWLFAALGLLRAGIILGALWLGVAVGATAMQIALALLGFIAVRLVVTRLAQATKPEHMSWK